MTDASLLAYRTTELRLAFDRGFAEPPRIGAATQDLLAIRVCGEPYAIRLSEVAGLFADKTITRVPGGATALLGIAGFRGTIVPVHSLRFLLGQTGTQSPRWLVIAATEPVALAFDAFEGRLRVAQDAIWPGQAHTATTSCAHEYVRTQDAVRPLLHLPSVLDVIAQSLTEAGTRNRT